MKKNSKIKVLLVDDHALVRAGLKAMLNHEPDIQVIDEASTGEIALKKIRENKPDIVLMDIKMPGIGGLETTKKMLHIYPDIRIVAVTACINDPYPVKLLETGALGFIAKECSSQELLEAIRHVAAGHRYVGAKIAQEMALRTTRQKTKKDKDNNSILASLSNREMQVLIMIGKGLTVQDIAVKLSVTPKTVNTYRYRLYDKLQVKSDVSLAHVAIQQGIVSIDEETKEE